MQKKLLLPVVLALALAGYPLPSHAICTKVGSIIAMSVDDADGSQNHRVLIRTHALADHYLFVDTSDNDFINAAIGFMTGQKQVEFTGDRASCPTVGEARDMGNMTSFIVTR